MVNRAVIVKDEYIVYASSNKLVPDNEDFTYSAALAAFVRARKQDIIHGVMFVDDAISLNGAQAVADAELSKVIYAKNCDIEDISPFVAEPYFLIIKTGKTKLQIITVS